ncbi:MAG: carboxymuconolactone decarboxylase family protein [Hyphomicrobiaceae bacterium]
MTAKPPRMPLLADDKMTPEQKKAVADIVSGPRGHLVGPFIPLMRSPEFMGRLQRTGEYLRFNSAFEPRLSELAILITARIWSQNFEWHHHRPIAEKAGLKSAVIDAIAEGRRPDAMAADEATIYDFLDELSRNKTVSEATYQRTVKAFGENGVIDLIGIHGYYSLLAMVLNVTQAPLPDNAKPGLNPLP